MKEKQTATTEVFAMNIQPLNNRVVIKAKKLEEKTKGGIYIPETAQEKSQEGIVVAIPQMEKCPLAVGDLVIYENFAGTELTLDGETVLVLKFEDILAKISK